MRIVVAMSGGVDSSAAAALLKEQGHEVIGITLRVYAYEKKKKCGSCCSPEDIDDARHVADALGIPFYVADVESLFKERVITPFVQSYLNGKTPIPCVACNQDVKFGFLLQRARQLGARLATGHYARIETAPDGTHQLLKARDEAKDQSYFLFTLGQSELADLVFPLGGLTKAEARAVAERHRLPTAQKPESMEICFVPDGDYRGLVEKVAGPQQGGDVVDGQGNKLAAHDGVHAFTVGQRKGLGFSSSEPKYVKSIDPATRQVVVGGEDEIYTQRFALLKPSWVSGDAPFGTPFSVRIRHRHAGAAGRLEKDPRGFLEVALDAPARAVTPGQAAVIYDGDRVLGGGWIA
jgi:tRNA-uridine 2-sulfurtransferase